MEAVKKRGRKAREPQIKISQICIDTKAMNLLDLNLYEMAILNIIHQYQNAEKIIKGWCMEEKKQIARDVRLTDIALLNYLKRLSDKGMIIRTDKALQVTDKYLQAIKEGQEE